MANGLQRFYESFTTYLMKLQSRKMDEFEFEIEEEEESALTFDQMKMPITVFFCGLGLSFVVLAIEIIVAKIKQQRNLIQQRRNIIQVRLSLRQQR